MRTVLACLLLLVLSNSTALAAEPTVEKTRDVSELLSPILAKYKLPGLVAAVVEGDRVVALGAVGVRKQGSPEKMTADDKIHLGSDTKAMTAMLIGQLVDAGQVKFDSTMAEVFPELSPKMNDDMAKVTILQLMSHTAGLAANPDLSPPALAALTSKPVLEQRKTVLETALNKTPANPPGTKFEYSNTGYIVLGAILEAKTGKVWEELIRERLFAPLGINSAGFGPPGEANKLEQPWGHRLRNGELEPLQRDNPDVLGPAGRAHMSISDWAKFISLYLSAEAGRPRLVSAETYRVLVTPVAPGEYAGGWGIVDRPWGHGKVLTHSGSNTMWFCVAFVAPKRNFAALAATNAGGTDATKACDEAVTALSMAILAPQADKAATPGP